MVAGLNHAFYMAVFGAILGWAQRLPRGQRWTAIVLGLATAAWLHAFHDTLPQILSRVLGAAATRRWARSAGSSPSSINWLGIAHARGRRGRRLAPRGPDPARRAARRGGRGRRHRGRLRDDHLLRRRASAASGGCCAPTAWAPSAASAAATPLEGELAFHKWRLTRPAPAGCPPRSAATRSAPRSAAWPTSSRRPPHDATRRPRRLLAASAPRRSSCSPATRRQRPARASAARSSPPSVGNSVLFHLQLADRHRPARQPGRPEHRRSRRAPTLIFGLLGWQLRPGRHGAAAAPVPGRPLRLRDGATSWSTRRARRRRARASSSRSTPSPGFPAGDYYVEVDYNRVPDEIVPFTVGDGASFDPRSSVPVPRPARSRTRARPRSWW